MIVGLRTFGITLLVSTVLVFSGPAFGQSVPAGDDVDKIISEARKAFGEKRDGDAFALYLKAARTGNPQAQFDLAKMYAGGFGTKRNLKEAKRLGLLAAKQGITGAQNLVGLLSKSLDPDVRALNDAVFWFQKAVVNGSASAQFSLRQMYLDGVGVRQDNSLGVALLEEAAQKGSIPAHHRLSRIYHKGLIVPRDVTRAIRYAKTAARGGTLEAAVMLSVAYANGYDVEKDIDESRKWMRIGTTGKSAEELFKLAAHYSHTPDGKLKRHPIALALLTEAAKQDHLPSMKAFAQISLFRKQNAGDVRRAIAMYERGVALGDPELTHGLAVLYLDGTEVPKDFKKGSELLGRAAEAGYAASQVRLAKLFFQQGKAGAMRPAERWFKRAADQGNAEARYRLATLYILGQRYEQPEDQTEERQHKLRAAIELLLLSSDQHYMPATSRLGRLRFHGTLVMQNVKQGLRFLRGAAAAGDANAQYDLAHAYFYGTNVAQDYAKAAHYLQLAAAQKHPDALYLLSRSYHNGFGIPKDEARAVKLASEALGKGNIHFMFPRAQAVALSDDPARLIHAYSMFSVIVRYLGKMDFTGQKAFNARAEIDRQLSDVERQTAVQKSEAFYLMVRGIRAAYD